MRLLWLYSLASAVGVACAVLSAVHVKHHFYQTVVYMTKSKAHMMLLGNGVVAAGLVLLTVLKAVFFGKLRPYEEMMLYERGWMTALESLVMFTVFRVDSSAWFASMFVMLVSAKAFHWLLEERLKFFEQSNPPWLRLARAFGAVVMLSVLDSAMVRFAWQDLMQSGLSVWVLFGFEYAILALLIVRCTMRYALFWIDARLDGQLESKGTWVFVSDLVTQFLALVLYTLLFAVVSVTIGPPLHIIRGLWMTLGAFSTRFVEFVRYRRIIAALDSKFPDATPDELGEAGLCVVCQSPMASAKKLACRHLVHKHCLVSWLEQKLECPTCRAPVAVVDPSTEELRRRQAERMRDRAAAAPGAADAGAAAVGVADAVVPGAPGAAAPAAADAPARAPMQQQQQHQQQPAPQNLFVGLGRGVAAPLHVVPLDEQARLLEAALARVREQQAAAVAAAAAAGAGAGAGAGAAPAVNDLEREHDNVQVRLAELYRAREERQRQRQQQAAQA